MTAGGPASRRATVDFARAWLGCAREATSNFAVENEEEQQAAALEAFEDSQGLSDTDFYLSLAAAKLNGDSRRAEVLKKISPELKSLRKAHAAVADLRQQVTDRPEGITKHLSALDEQINGSLENYRPERVDRVDRAILRLATYELLHCPDIPTAVVIDEAIELSRAFSTTESKRFINGILDKIRKVAGGTATGNFLKLSVTDEVKEGACADVLIYDENPLKDVEVIVDHKAHLKLVVNGGKIYKTEL